MDKLESIQGTEEIIKKSNIHREMKRSFIYKSITRLYVKIRKLRNNYWILKYVTTKQNFNKYFGNKI